MKTSISISIDLEDDFEKELFEYVMSKGKRKKSSYLKRLIYADKIGVARQEITTSVADDAEADEDLDAMMDCL